MSDPQEPYTSWMDSLHAFPKLAEGVGQFMAAFASLERFLWELYGEILGANGNAAIAMLGHIESFAIKLTAIENFLPYCALTDQAKGQAATALERARGINTFRNTLAHGIYLSDENGTVVDVMAYATTTTRKPKLIRLTAELLSEETAKIFSLRDDIRDTFFPNFNGAHRPPHIR